MTERGVAIITGASSGIGEALALELARRGWRVGLLARRRERLEQIHAKIALAGGISAWAAADVGSRTEVVAAIQQLATTLGPVDLLVANAGVGGPISVEPFNTPDIEKQFQVNFFGAVYAIEAVLPAMLQRGRGHIAGVSSMGAYLGMPGQEAYSASKAALSNFLQGLRLRLRDRGICITTISPGFVWTPMTEHHKFKMPFLVQADDAARRMANALERKRKVFDFPWPMALLMRLARRAPDWVVARFFKDRLNYN